jgi:hypothetical protein
MKKIIYKNDNKNMKNFDLKYRPKDYFGGKNKNHDEVEICSIFLNSVQGEIITLRAKKKDDDFIFWIGDEHSNKYSLKQTSSLQTLTLQEVVDLLNTCKMKLFGTKCKPGIIRYYIEDAIESMQMLKDEAMGFVTVNSDFYPDLEKYYEEQKSIWCDEILFEVYGDEDEDK